MCWVHCWEWRILGTTGGPLSGRDRPPNQVIWLLSPSICFRDPCHRVGYESSSGSSSPCGWSVLLQHAALSEKVRLCQWFNHTANRATALETLETFAQLFVCLLVFFLVSRLCFPVALMMLSWLPDGFDLNHRRVTLSCSCWEKSFLSLCCPEIYNLESLLQPTVQLDTLYTWFYFMQRGKVLTIDTNQNTSQIIDIKYIKKKMK